MQAQLSAIAYVSAAICVAYLLTRSTESERWYRSGIMFWFASAVMLFLLKGAMGPSLVVLGALLFFCVPRAPEQKLPFLILVTFAVPIAIKADVPFPQINYLLTVDFQVLIGMLAVAPALISNREAERSLSQPIGWGGFFMCAYFFVVTLLMFRALPLTATLRFGAEIVLGILLIYLFALRVAASESAMERTMAALYIAAALLACIALTTQIKQWNFYSLLDVDARIFKANEVRYGILRTNTTINSVLFGFVEAVGLVLLLRSKQISGNWPKYGWIVGVLLTMGYIVSMSRGAWLAGIVVFSTYYLFKSRLPNSMVMVVIALFAVSLGVLSFSGEGFSDHLDPFQSFNYRRQLYEASWDQFLSAPVIGDLNFLQSGRFDQLIQGEGIVDVVSVYLQIVLQFGLIGLTLFLAPFLIALRGILKARNLQLNLQIRTQIAGTGAFLLGYMTLIVTVSDVSLILEFGVILVALASAAVVIANQHTKRLPMNPGRPSSTPPNFNHRPKISVRHAPGRGRIPGG